MKSVLLISGSSLSVYPYRFAAASTPSWMDWACGSLKLLATPILSLRVSSMAPTLTIEVLLRLRPPRHRYLLQGRV